MTMATMTTIPEIDAALARTFDTADLRTDDDTHECARCAQRIEDGDVTYLRVANRLLPYCAACGDTLCPDEAPEYWADRMEDDQ